MHTQSVDINSLGLFLSAGDQLDGIKVKLTHPAGVIFGAGAGGCLNKFNLNLNIYASKSYCYKFIFSESQQVGLSENVGHVVGPVPKICKLAHQYAQKRRT